MIHTYLSEMCLIFNITDFGIYKILFLVEKEQLKPMVTSHPA